MKSVTFLALLLMVGPFVARLSGATYYSSYGQSRIKNITVSSGTHNFQVNGIAQYKNTTWDVNGVYTGSAENDWSGFWAVDPEYTYYCAPGTTTQFKATIFDDNWNYIEYHEWNVTVPAPDTTPPSIPSLTSPSSGTITTDDTVSLDWSNSSDSGSGMDYYQVQVDNGSSFS
ncbi:hypothetical protein, partial [Haloferula sp. A504]|uniref:hypothetical protein n=1 Tax=Haloferula sp. A504 TaxID=3373601 RepID=UPI0031BF37CD|nr:hypothetical protein [Verrucomicrobiaceae bacterium E54]